MCFGRLLYCSMIFGLLTSVAFADSSFFNSTINSWFIKHPLPALTRVSSEFGQRTMNGKVEHHSGIDFAAPAGTPIYATGTGIVTRSGWGTGYGNYIEIDHQNGYLTRYAHASKLHV